MENSFESSETVEVKVRRTKTKGSNWLDQETAYFLELCIEGRILKLFKSKRHKHKDIYKTLEGKMREGGFLKSGAQMQTKMKHLKEAYFKCKRHNSVGAADQKPFPFFDAMERLLGGTPVQTAEAVQTQVKLEFDVGSSPTQEQDLLISQLSSEEVLLDEIKLEEVNNDVADPVVPVATITAVPSTCEDSADAAIPIHQRTKTRGRLSNAKRIENYTERFIKKQSEALSEILLTQNRMMEESFQKQMIEQRKWEAQMMQKEHEHQLLQMKMLMDGFMQGLQTLNSNSPQTPQFPAEFPLQVPCPFTPSTSSSSNTYHSEESPPPLIDPLLLSPSGSSTMTHHPSQSPFLTSLLAMPTHSSHISQSPSPTS